MKTKFLSGLWAVCLLVSIACKKTEKEPDAKKAQALTITTNSSLPMNSTVKAEATSSAGATGGTIYYSIAPTATGAGSATINTDKQSGSIITPTKIGTVILTASTDGNAQFEASNVSITITIGSNTLAAIFTLTSVDMNNNAPMKIGQVNTCNGHEGQNRSPQLTWTDAPQGTLSYAITMYDPDATWWHWVVFNIPAGTTSIPNNASQTGIAGSIQSVTSFGGHLYGGPCPPSGTHRYVTTVYALNVASLAGLTKDSSPEEVKDMLQGKILAEAAITAPYSAP